MAKMTRYWVKKIFNDLSSNFTFIRMTSESMTATPNSITGNRNALTNIAR